MFPSFPTSVGSSAHSSPDDERYHDTIRWQLKWKNERKKKKLKVCKHFSFVSRESVPKIKSSNNEIVQFRFRLGGARNFNFRSLSRPCSTRTSLQLTPSDWNSLIFQRFRHPIDIDFLDHISSAFPFFPKIFKWFGKNFFPYFGFSFYDNFFD